MSASNHPGDVLSAQALEAVVTAAPLPIISVDLEGCVISLFPSDAQTAETLLHRADAALYQAKGRGKNRYALFGEV